MGDLFRLLLISALFALGAWVHLQFEAASIRAARIAVLTLVVLWVLLFLTGLSVRSAGPHRGLAHLFVAAAWMVLPFAIGVNVAEGMRSRDWSSATRVMALVLAMGATFAAASTGYLGRLSDRPADVLRFRLIHQMLTPGLLCACLVAWLRLPGAREGGPG